MASDLREGLGPDDARTVGDALAAWRDAEGSRRLQEGDASLWTGGDEASWLGWLTAPVDQEAELAGYRELAKGLLGEGVSHVLLLGMGGSSLCCEVLAEVLGPAQGHPPLQVADSTVPAQVRAVEARIDPARTVCIVSSKSGGTVETDVLRRHFAARIDDPRRFIAITDPGSALERRARDEGWRAVAHGVPEIGGRFSALSPFGLVPAALIGADVDDLLARARRLARDPEPAIELGVALGALARAGRDKLTLLASPGLAALGPWLEQLIAESTGKNGVGIVPVDGEAPLAPDRYGADRVFAYLRLASAPDPAQDEAAAALRAAGHPLLRVEVAEPAELGAEFLRWELATAAAGAVLGIHPFDQPDVEAAKVAARELIARYEETGALPQAEPLLREGAFEVYADPASAEAFAALGDLDGVLRGHLGRLGPGDYLALNAFVERNAAHGEALSRLRNAVARHAGHATALGFGPRFLHSTGQLHKGGPNRALVLEVTGHDAQDLPIPGQRISFGVLKDAQSRGDFDVLCDRGRRALRVHIGSGDIGEGLTALADAVERALA
jgi:glucose-6-phosphate isomerase